MHVVAGAAAGAAAGLWYAHVDGPDLGLAIAAGTIGGALPDIDHPRATIWRWVWAAALWAAIAAAGGWREPGLVVVVLVGLGMTQALLTRLLTHRGVTHSLLGLASVWLGVAWLAEMVGVVGVDALTVALAAGYASHLALDLLTPAGVPLLWPWKRPFRVPMLVAAAVVTVGACLWWVRP